MIIPTVIDKTPSGERVYDIYSRLLEDRIVFLGQEIDDAVANTVIAQLLYLQSRGKNEEVTLYINSPGGSVSAALAIYDTMRHISPAVSTVCVGLAASAASLLLAAGEKGKRKILPNAEVMIHQVLGGARGQASDIDIQARHILALRDRLNKILAKHTGQKVAKIAADTDRDYYMTAVEAKKYGIVDKILQS
ncbi:MAG TPA: ATP-dependent Clp protease proteolytic subunit [Candidatus Moranbacteria bacterium]|nr:ATP-dependent Clp protease proteolytic subunit [Candidatus Moranbacteria bacterium]